MLKFFLLLVIIPALIKSTIPSETISECIPKSFFSLRKFKTAKGIAPIPNCKVSPSFIRLAQLAPIFSSSSPTN